jgi:hypothetical protein
MLIILCTISRYLLLAESYILPWMLARGEGNRASKQPPLDVDVGGAEVVVLVAVQLTVYVAQVPALAQAGLV